jgi:hypothetical protein
MLMLSTLQSATNDATPRHSADAASKAPELA